MTSVSVCLGFLKITIKRCVCYCIVPLLLSATSHAAEDENTEPSYSLSVAQLNWCPQICPRGKDAGYIIDIVREVFEGTNFNLNYQTMSYPVARGRTERGEIDALLAPAKMEAPSLLYPTQPVGFQRVCFYTLADSLWTYTGETSLADLTIGIAIDISLEEIHDYVQKHENQFVFQAESKRYIEESIRMLEIGRLDTFVFNENSVLYYIRKQKWHDQIRLAGCVSKAPVFMAFSPALEGTLKSRTAIQHLDRKILEMKKNGTMMKIMNRYGLPDWSKF
ncbi:MAG: substrate-binding periplasmic protein [Kordiimonas sp.]